MTTYIQALVAYDRALAKHDFTAALAAVKTAPAPEGPDVFPDGTTDRPYAYLPNSIRADEIAGHWTSAQAKQLLAAL